MNVYEERLKTLENEIANLRVTVEKCLTLKPSNRNMKKQNKAQILQLFGQWDGEVDNFLNDFYERRNRRGRLE